MPTLVLRMVTVTGGSHGPSHESRWTLVGRCRRTPGPGPERTIMTGGAARSSRAWKSLAVSQTRIPDAQAAARLAPGRHGGPGRAETVEKTRDSESVSLRLLTLWA